MKAETGVIKIGGKYSIYFEYHRNDKTAKTAVMVNGALATTTSFSQSMRNLKDHANIVLFDLPFTGRSREHNISDGSILTKEDEVEILLHLIDRFSVNYLISASWGGVSSLLSLVEHPPTIERAVILSFSPIINKAMYDYMVNALGFLRERDISGAAQLLNRTVGKYLPRLLKAHNYQYLLSMIEGNEEQILFHINQIFELDQSRYVNRFPAIEVPVLFINGALDEYTTTEDVRGLVQFVRYSQFAVIPGAGHFLDLESTHARRAAGEIMRMFFAGGDCFVEGMPAGEIGKSGQYSYSVAT
jgi:pimeloyl-ACP methyl ester carboxylesterase